MPSSLRRAARSVRTSVLAALALALPATAIGSDLPRVHAITGARIVTAPGQVIERGTVVMRDGIITAVGASVAIPPDARVWNADSLTVYAGLIDACVLPAEAGGGGAPRPGGGPAVRPGQRDTDQPARGAAASLAVVVPEYRIVESLALSADQLKTLREAGFAAVHMAPRRGIFRGQSAVIGLGDGPLNHNTLVGDAAQIVSIEATPQAYPGSLMGAIAVIRQGFLDAKWYRDAHAAYARRPIGTSRPETNHSWAALQGAIAGTQPVWMLADDMLEVLRASSLAREAGVRVTVVGAGDEYKRAGEIAATGLPMVVPVNFPEAPEVGDPGNVLEVTTEELRHWQRAPGNAAALTQAGVRYSLSSFGMKDPKGFRANIGKAIAQGLSESEALAAVTTRPAEMLGVANRLGTIAPGKVANLTVTRGALFAEGSKVREVWVDGRRHEVSRDETSPKGDWTFPFRGATAVLGVKADKDTSVTVIAGADTLKAEAVRLEDKRLRFTARSGGRSWDYDLRAAHDALVGTGADGRDVVARAKRESKPAPKPEPLVPMPQVMGISEAWRARAPEAPAAVLVRNATVWTMGPQGVIAGADMLVRGGRIAAVGKGLAAPAGAVVVDGTGKHVAPGIIDEHSHAAILGNVNECTNNITCEVRIQDVINSESVNLYRQLAGGVTAMQLLHGSCNSIGGQAAFIKSKWGEGPDGLFQSWVPGTVKFALGENPKQSNWGNDRTDRYPKTRAGVEQSIRDAFLAARDYDRAWAEFRAGQRPLPPRRDLQLDAVSEIINGRRHIHAHSYRQDEILMLMRVAEEFGIKVNTFTHILEGYKVADEMAVHGAAAMGFSDWWGFKQEVLDAIPHNGYLMWDRGVVTGFNSDSDELARRLNTEAAKAIKYGGVPREEALKFVTLNPAKSMLADARLGSIEVGKDADFAIWSGEPLSPYALCEQTWIEGRKYFDRAADLAGRAELARERDALIARARAARKEGGGGGGGRGNWPPRYLEDTDMSGNLCGHSGHEGHDHPFMSEAERRARQAGEEVQR